MCKKITVKIIEDLDACGYEVELFKDFCKEYGFSEGVEVTVENLKKADEYGLDIIGGLYYKLIPVDIIIESKDGRFVYFCLEHVKGLSKQQKNALVDILIENKDVRYSSFSLEYVKGISKEKFNTLVNIVIESNIRYYSLYCLKYAKGLSKEQRKALQGNDY